MSTNRRILAVRAEGALTAAGALAGSLGMAANASLHGRTGTAWVAEYRQASRGDDSSSPVVTFEQTSYTVTEGRDAAVSLVLSDCV